MTILRAVLFDLGDTLVDLGEGRGSYEARLAVRAGKVYDVLSAAGVALPDREPFVADLSADSEAQYHAAVAQGLGIDIYTVTRRYFERRDIAAFDGLVEAAGEAYCRGGVGVPSPLMPGALELLSDLQARGFVLGAISNTVQPRPFLLDALVRRGLARFFRAVRFSSESAYAKPHPAIFLDLLNELGVAPGEAVYVGDRIVPDVGGAHAAGMKGVLVEVPGRPEHHPVIVPDARIGSLSELPAALTRLYDYVG